jgi:hypothetical protein
VEQQLELLPEDPKPVRVLVPKGNAPKLGEVSLGQLLTVQLPNERTRAEVTEVVDQDNIKAKLVITPMSKSHMYQLNQTLPFHRISGVMGDRWEVT